jgi:hypothetical protein
MLRAGTTTETKASLDDGRTMALTRRPTGR